MSVGVYIYFDGNCREAVDFYTQVFNTEKPKIMAFGAMPANPQMPIPEEAKNRIMHTELTIGGSTVMFSDTFPGTPHIVGNNVCLMVDSDNVNELKTWFDQLKAGGRVQMELQETFWSKCYGFLIDKFGIGWQFNSHQ